MKLIRPRCASCGFGMSLQAITHIPGMRGKYASTAIYRCTISGCQEPGRVNIDVKVGIWG